jgi:hypothetical protein
MLLFLPLEDVSKPGKKNTVVNERFTMLPVWESIPYPSEDDTISWNFMYETLHFTPSVQLRPGIVEPTPSITYDIGHIYTVGETQAQHLEEDLNQKTLTALQACTRPEQRLYALDWQHPCYWFYPHRMLGPSNAEDWYVPVLPNGDYYIFLAENFSFGIFGHPWEQTMCIFGQPLLNAYSRSQPLLFMHVVRIDGKPNVSI